MSFLYWLAVFLGFLPLLITVFRMKRLEHMKKKGGRSVAIVQAQHGRAYGVLHKVEVAYKVVEHGRTVVKAVSVPGAPRQPGDKLTVYYSKHKPTYSIVDNKKDWTLPLLLTSGLALLHCYTCYKIFLAIS